MKDRQDDIEMWKTKRRLMRFCGYAGMGKHVGWYRAYIDGNELKFMTTAGSDRVYISLSKFMDMKRQQQQEADEADYYGETQKLIKDLTGIKMKKADNKPDMDGFIPEDDDDADVLHFG